ncbi:MAG TPA: 4'-phosphopantetheinyl transferase superfamily protein [Leptolyngbyaceae cyanobacterium]
MITALPAALCKPLPLPLPELVGRQWVGGRVPPAENVLSDREFVLWQRFPAQSPRRQEWLLGRLVAKAAVSHLMASNGKSLAWPEIEILPTAAGKPTVFCAALPDQKLPEVSISHAERHIVAVASPPSEPIGIDIECLGRVRVADISAIAFAPNDIAQLPALATEYHYLALWAAKEAAAKAAGTGLLGRPTAWRIEMYQPSPCGWGDQITVRYQHQVFPVLVWRQSDAVTALCHNRIAQFSFLRRRA